MNTKLRQKSNNNFEKDFFQDNKQFIFWKNYGECKKI